MRSSGAGRSQMDLPQTRDAGSRGERPPLRPMAMDDTQSLWTLLRQASDPDAVDAIAELVRDGPDDALTRINALHFADSRGLPLDPVISAFLHATRLGLFELA